MTPLRKCIIVNVDLLTPRFRLALSSLTVPLWPESQVDSSPKGAILSNFGFYLVLAVGQAIDRPDQPLTLVY